MSHACQNRVDALRKHKHRVTLIRLCKHLSVTSPCGKIAAKGDLHLAPEWIKVHTWMGAFGHFSPKPTKFFGDWLRAQLQCRHMSLVSTFVSMM